MGILRQRKYFEEGNIYMNGSQRRYYKRPLLTYRLCALKKGVELPGAFEILALQKKEGGSSELPIQIFR